MMQFNVPAYYYCPVRAYCWVSNDYQWLTLTETNNWYLRNDIFYRKSWDFLFVKFQINIPQHSVFVCFLYNSMIVLEKVFFFF